MTDDDRSTDALEGANRKLIKIEISHDPRRVIQPEYAHEEAVAIYDILDDNLFYLQEADGPYHLILSTDNRHVHFDVRSADAQPLKGFIMALGPFRRIMRDYYDVCNHYYDAIRTKSPTQIQAIDMGRRALHNEGSDLLQERLGNYLTTDNMTARRLFTLIYVLTHRS